MNDKKSATIAVRTGITTDSQHHAVVPPIYLSTNYEFPEFGEVPTYDYARGGNPTRSLLEKALSELEHGAGAVVTNCGMSAINLMLSLLSPDDLIVAPHDCYGGTYRLFDSRAKKGAFNVAFVDQTNSTALNAALENNPKLVWIETPSNPLLRVVDIAEICKKAQAVGAWVAVDNTFLSPALQQPLTLGADFVVHSTTKFINGHSDTVGGVVVAKDAELADELKWWGNCIGATGNAFDSYMTLRGLRTLNVRMRQHEENSAAILELLKHEPLVKVIYHPSLPEHPGHEIAKKQQSGFGGMLSFELKGSEEELKLFLGSLKLFSLAESLGGVESLVTHPGSMTHRAMSDEAQAEAGIAATLLRLSIGLEDHSDLVADLKYAFDKVRESQQ
ncbi:O-succinylhomoserine (thiol)-lyase [Enterovibrio nigricans]|uniref:Cystathionine gamma-synthase n=1 Tax=Enterovibrio nigricans DSM 22720 TaxID=1121868 RepID=A0A1T4U8Q0_9GAMM|nr:O-succinylhomoserine (thiol)-lyase [Enterovibrio nigricans]PKF51545.1 O-succinylhomoserine (thiol)-lyase [Enterovibrio nigricans]SKA49162.1 cystathionine gamma-synthase [Enterovibrio nigricans DSM 22720]